MLNRTLQDKFTQKERFCWKIWNFSCIQIRKVILLNYHNNYVERSNQLLEYHNFLKFFATLLIIFKVSTKLFSDP